MTAQNLKAVVAKVDVTKVLATAEKALVVANAINQTQDYNSKDKVTKVINKAGSVLSIAKLIASVFGK